MNRAVRMSWVVVFGMCVVGQEAKAVAPKRKSAGEAVSRRSIMGPSQRESSPAHAAPARIRSSRDIMGSNQKGSSGAKPRSHNKTAGSTIGNAGRPELSHETRGVRRPGNFPRKPDYLGLKPLDNHLDGNSNNGNNNGNSQRGRSTDTAPDDPSQGITEHEANYLGEESVVNDPDRREWSPGRVIAYGLGGWLEMLRDVAGDPSPFYPQPRPHPNVGPPTEGESRPPTMGAPPARAPGRQDPLRLSTVVQIPNGGLYPDSHVLPGDIRGTPGRGRPRWDPNGRERAPGPGLGRLIPEHGEGSTMHVPGGGTMPGSGGAGGANSGGAAGGWPQYPNGRDGGGPHSPDRGSGGAKADDKPDSWGRSQEGDLGVGPYSSGPSRSQSSVTSTEFGDNGKPKDTNNKKGDNQGDSNNDGDSGKKDSNNSGDKPKENDDSDDDDSEDNGGSGDKDSNDSQGKDSSSGKDSGDGKKKDEGVAPDDGRGGGGGNTDDTGSRRPRQSRDTRSGLQRMDARNGNATRSPMPGGSTSVDDSGKPRPRPSGHTARPRDTDGTPSGNDLRGQWGGSGADVGPLMEDVWWYIYGPRAQPQH